MQEIFQTEVNLNENTRRLYRLYGQDFATTRLLLRYCPGILHHKSSIRFILYTAYSCCGKFKLYIKRLKRLTCKIGSDKYLIAEFGFVERIQLVNHCLCQRILKTVLIETGVLHNERNSFRKLTSAPAINSSEIIRNTVGEAASSRSSTFRMAMTCSSIALAAAVMN